MLFLFRPKHLGLVIFTIFVLSACSSHPPPVTVVDAKTAIGIDDRLLPVETTGTFSDGTKKVFCWFQWKDAQLPLTITARWTFITDNIHILDYNFPIPRKEGFGGVSLVMPEGKKLPLGKYKVDLIYSDITLKKDVLLKSVTFTIDLAPLSYFRVTGKSTLTAGSTQDLTITGYDRFGNIATAYNGPHSLIFSGANNAFDGTVARVDGINIGNPVNVTFTSGVSDANSIKLTAYRAESTTVNATDSAHNSTGYGLALTVTPAGAHNLVFLHGPSNATAGESIAPPVTLQVEDAFGNPRTEDDSTTVTMTFGTNAGGGTLSGTTAQTAKNGIVTFPDLAVNKAANGYTLVALSASLSSAPSGKFDITPAAARYLTMAGAATMVAGTTNELTIKAYDAFDNLATGYTGARSLTFSGPAASPNGTMPTIEGARIGAPVDINFTAGVSNTNAATLVAFAAEGTTINASDGSINSNGHGLSLVVAPAANDNLTFLQGPSNAVFRKIIVPSVKVQIRDVYNNLKTDDNTTQVTAALGANPRRAKLSGTLIQTASGGTAIFDNLSVNKIASGYTLTAAASGLTEAVSGPFDIRKK